MTVEELEAPSPARRAGLGGRFHRLFAASIVTNVGDGMGTVAYPWLASAITRNPLLIACIAVAQRLPWLVFSLPAGVITDRVDRRRAMVLMDTCRFGITAIVGITVLGTQGSLPAPDELESVTGTRAGLYVLVLVATLLLGCCEVLRDNSAQTILPALVEPAQLERANGRLQATELVANTFIGPPLGSLLLGVAFALPILLDSASFLGAAIGMFTIAGTFRAHRPEGAAPANWRRELGDGLRWLRGHEVLFPMAVILGLLNMASFVSFGTIVLYAQEVLHTSPFTFALLSTGMAIGGVVGGFAASATSKRLGSGACLAITLAVSAVLPLVIAVVSHWVVVMVLMGLIVMSGTLWNVITVSFRQSIIPPHLLGRVNSAYRFFGWGMMPVGAALGGVTVAVVDVFASRTVALRATFVLDGAICAALFVLGRHYLSTERIERARATAAHSHDSPTDSRA